MDTLSCINSGHVSLCTKMYHPISILFSLTSPPTEENEAALTWIISSTWSSGSIDKNMIEVFMKRFPLYSNIRDELQGLSSLSTIEQYNRLGDKLPMYCLDLDLYNKDSLIKLKDRVKYMRLESVPANNETLQELLSYLNDSYSSMNNKHQQMIRSYLTEWLSPVMDRAREEYIGINIDLLTRVFSYVEPNVIYPKLVRYGSLYRYSSRTAYWYAYLLGYPIHAFRLGPGEIGSLLERLRHPTALVSSVNRCKIHTLRCVREEISLEVSSLSSSTIQCLEVEYENSVINTNDSIGLDPIISYSPFDIIRYKTSNNKIAQLTRREYEYTRESKKNPWTQETIPISVMQEMELRLNLAKMYDLPECLPLDVTLRCIFRGI